MEPKIPRSGTVPAPSGDSPKFHQRFLPPRVFFLPPALAFFEPARRVLFFERAAARLRAPPLRAALPLLAPCPFAALRDPPFFAVDLRFAPTDLRAPPGD